MSSGSIRLEKRVKRVFSRGKFTGKNLCQSLFNLVMLQVSGLQHFIKRDFNTGVFFVNFVKFLRTPVVFVSDHLTRGITIFTAIIIFT